VLNFDSWALANSLLIVLLVHPRKIIGKQAIIRRRITRKLTPALWRNKL
jgi:hypothetical protein